MSVYEELLENKKQKRIKCELEKSKKDNQNINNELNQLKYVHSIALERNRECNKKIDCYVLEIQRLNNIIEELEKYLINQINDGRSVENLWLMGCYDEDKDILNKLKELKGDSNV